MNMKELPAGFAMALAQNEDAMKRFEKMDEDDKARVLKHARSVNSKQEMKTLVYDLSKN